MTVRPGGDRVAFVMITEIILIIITRRTLYPPDRRHPDFSITRIIRIVVVVGKDDDFRWLFYLGYFPELVIGDCRRDGVAITI